MHGPQRPAYGPPHQPGIQEVGFDPNADYPPNPSQSKFTREALAQPFLSPSPNRDTTGGGRASHNEVCAKDTVLSAMDEDGLAAISECSGNQTTTSC